MCVCKRATSRFHFTNRDRHHWAWKYTRMAAGNQKRIIDINLCHGSVIKMVDFIRVLKSSLKSIWEIFDNWNTLHVFIELMFSCLYYKVDVRMIIIVNFICDYLAPGVEDTKVGKPKRWQEANWRKAYNRKVIKGKPICSSVFITFGILPFPKLLLLIPSGQFCFW